MTQKLRSMLFAPGNKLELLEKFSKIQPDAAVIDLEDSVPDAEKFDARKNLLEFASKANHNQFALFARVNPISSGHFEFDIQAIPPQLDGIIIPKVNSAEELGKAQEILIKNSVEIGVIVGIETVQGVASANEILGNESVLAAYFGAEDYVLDLGGVRTVENDEVFVARSLLAIAGRLNGVPVIDQIVADIADSERFTKEAKQARALGFSGKLCIHPSQVSLANRSFSPSVEEIERAKELLSIYEQAVSRGSASVVFDGQMVDEALAKQARRILDLSN